MRNTVIALGFFDGVHRGHQKILNEAVCMAIKNNTHSAVVTFENQPRAFLTGRSPNLLTNVGQRENYIRQMGIDEVYMLPFDVEMASRSPESETMRAWETFPIPSTRRPTRSGSAPVLAMWSTTLPASRLRVAVTSSTPSAP